MQVESGIWGSQQQGPRMQAIETVQHNQNKLHHLTRLCKIKVALQWHHAKSMPKICKMPTSCDSCPISSAKPSILSIVNFHAGQWSSIQSFLMPSWLSRQAVKLPSPCPSFVGEALSFSELELPSRWKKL